MTKARKRIFANLLVAGGLLVAPGPLLAFDFQPSQRDFYLYPVYCKAKMADLPANRAEKWEVALPINEQQVRRWRKALGPDWQHLHHFCAGLTYLSRSKDREYLRRSARTTRSACQTAIKEISYTRENSKPGHPLWLEMSLRYAEASSCAGRRGDAFETYDELLELEPGNADVHTEKAKLFKRTGDINAAIKVLENALDKVDNRGPVWFYLASYYAQLGDLSKAKAAVAEAEAAGMKVDRIKRKLGERP